MKTIGRATKWFYILLLLPAVMGLSAWQGWQWWHWASAPPVSATEAEGRELNLLVEVPEGTTTWQIGNTLAAAGAIQSALAWKIWAFWLDTQNSEGSFKAGTYVISPTDSLRAIADQIRQGETTEQSFTIREGASIDEMAANFAAQDYFTAAAFVAASEQIPSDRYPWLPADLPSLEGFLYPDTYQVPEGMTPEQAIALMLDRFQAVALPIYQQAETESPYTLQEWVTLASLVEKEAAVDAERGTIASVFAERLRRGMRLEADPTVEYALDIQQTPEQPLTLAQVQTPHPYNTYLNEGLPPTAIASPGEASLRAALNPEPTELLYFVARYDGTHEFNETLAAHEAAVERIREQRQQAAAPESPET